LQGDWSSDVCSSDLGVFSTGVEVARHPDARDRGKRRKRMPQRNVFAERNKVHFPIHLSFPVRGNEQRSIVGAIAFLVISAKQKEIGRASCRESWKSE